MKKSLLLIALALFSLIVLGQEQLPVQPSEQPQVQPAEQPPAPAPVQLQSRDLKRFRFPGRSSTPARNTRPEIIG